jgi:tRNA(fMet)-specific endonuclease VapC
MAKKQRKIVLDTNIVFELLKENEKHLNQVDVIDFQSLYVTSITVLETYYGMRVKEERKTKELFNSIRKISPDKEVFKKAEELMFTHRGRRPQLPDCLIAAICLLDNCELYTLNVKDFDYLGVKIFKPL